MDDKSLEYLVYARQSLRELRERSEALAFVISELKKFGFKPKPLGSGAYCDVGSGKNRLALYADCVADGQAEILLTVARKVGAKCPVALRLIFNFDAESGDGTGMIEQGVLDRVSEVYALRICPQLEHGKIGYCYGTMLAGRCDFSLDFSGNANNPDSAARAAEQVENAAHIAADKHGLTVSVARSAVDGDNACRCEYSLSMFDMSKAEAAMLDIERAALRADDELSTSHRLTASCAFIPLKNHAFAVDRVRAAMGERCVEVAPSAAADGFSCYTENVTGCMALLGTKCDDGALQETLYVGTELFIGLIRSCKS